VSTKSKGGLTSRAQGYAPVKKTVPVCAPQDTGVDDVADARIWAQRRRRKEQLYVASSTAKAAALPKSYIVHALAFEHEHAFVVRTTNCGAYSAAGERTKKVGRQLLNVINVRIFMCEGYVTRAVVINEYRGCIWEPGSMRAPLYSPALFQKGHPVRQM